MGRVLFRIVQGATGFVVLALLWELARLTGILSPTWAPSVLEMLTQLVKGFTDGTWLRVLPSTLFAWLVALLIATVIGVFWGGLAGASLWVRSGSGVVLALLRPVPAVALLPVAIILLGLRPQMVLVLVAFAAIWPVLFNTLYAVRDLPEQYLDTARALGYRRIATYVRVQLVGALPGIATGIRVSAGIALVITVSIELVVGNSGLGAYIVHARSSGQIAVGYAGLILAGLLGVAATALLQLLERRLLGWSADNRRMHA
jgi:NitT/TauT family transport system permease protein